MRERKKILQDSYHPTNFVEYNAITTKKYCFLLPPGGFLYLLPVAIGFVLSSLTRPFLLFKN